MSEKERPLEVGEKFKGRIYINAAMVETCVELSDTRVKITMKSGSVHCVDIAYDDFLHIIGEVL